MAVIAFLFVLYLAFGLAALVAIAALTSLGLRLLTRRYPSLILRAPGLATFASFFLAFVLVVIGQAGLGAHGRASSHIFWAAFVLLSYAICTACYRRLFKFEDGLLQLGCVSWGQCAVLALAPCVLLASAVVALLAFPGAA